ncbi:hypothetical protein ND748_00315 [Frankia sp. AiPs1]|uniref:hypothetical protein n=1 Tax=Frankia sp. AiPs1 TaxID=573493 RepID=UPI002044B416|nr:hypothetical protein [Frankia sp. AiPs1]MCM3920140.1 hypothetical protein [Frankia sp. AiPs1]
MLYLDCHTPASALRSLTAAFHVREDVLVRAIRERSMEGDFTGEHEEQAVKAFLSEVNVEFDSTRFGGAYYFHGTRSFDPDSFLREGILPLGQVIERIWSSLYELIGDRITERDWQRFRADLEGSGSGHSGFLYRHKVSNASLHGPYALLVRGNHFNPGAIGCHDYLATPEIVQDIGRSFGHNLQEAFEAASKKCIVKFRSPDVGKAAVIAAFWYVYSAIRSDHDPAGWASLYGVDCKGSVAPNDVVGVEQLP